MSLLDLFGFGKPKYNTDQVESCVKGITDFVNAYKKIEPGATRITVEFVKPEREYLFNMYCSCHFDYDNHDMAYLYHVSDAPPHMARDFQITYDMLVKERQLSHDEEVALFSDTGDLKRCMLGDKEGIFDYIEFTLSRNSSREASDRYSAYTDMGGELKRRMSSCSSPSEILEIRKELKRIFSYKQDVVNNFYRDCYDHIVGKVIIWQELE